MIPRICLVLSIFPLFLLLNYLPCINLVSEQTSNPVMLLQPNIPQKKKKKKNQANEHQIKISHTAACDTPSIITQTTLLISNNPKSTISNQSPLYALLSLVLMHCRCKPPTGPSITTFHHLRVALPPKVRHATSTSDVVKSHLDYCWDRRPSCETHCGPIV
jgi:hypothetical protein